MPERNGQIGRPRVLIRDRKNRMPVMDFEKITSALSAAFESLLAKCPRFTQRNSFILITTLSIIVMAAFTAPTMMKMMIDGWRNSGTIENSQNIPPKFATYRTADGQAGPADFGFQAQNNGSVVIVNGKNEGNAGPGFVFRPTVITPARYERVYFLESDGRDRPIFMSRTLAECNLIQGFDVVARGFLDPAMTPQKAWEDLINKQVKLDFGTEVEELKVDLDAEMAKLPPGTRFVAKLWIESLAKVRILDGPHVGKTGWVYRPLMQKDRRPALGQ